ncbi:alpha-D-ribose 1-methylphosphonate 5-triphosphate synthase subunit PhnG [Rhodovulum iodosum]|uniref:Alpha-D-ribose 1-methylphosphonate 5-triphosphate synthase subunit PhnG n=1 Tax=Rhodovulum iodosum TaxID=68291 RepID=A0ABV3XMW9_9RHOB
MGAAVMRARAEWLKVLARCPEAALEAALAGHDTGAAEWLRRPETGMVMLEGRAGGTGQRFSLGQATVTRATCRMGADVGVGYLMGHFPRRAELMALADAVLQGPDGPALHAALIAPQEAAQVAARTDRARAAAATTVEFFTMSRETGPRSS